MLIACLAIIGGLMLLVYGADRFVHGAASTARILGIPPLIIGMTIVGIATSMPEVLVGSVAAWDGKTAIAVGNAIGSNIANIGLVLGVTVLFKPFVIASKTLRREYLLMCLSIVIALIFMLDNHLSRFDGLILILCLFTVTWWIVQVAKGSPKSDPLVGEFEKELKPVKSVKISLLLLFGGLLLLLGGAELLVRGAVIVAKSFGVSDLVIGLTVIAVGTSLPELAASIMSVIKKEADIAIGNIIGSNMFNMLMVLGIPSTIRPATLNGEVMTRDFPVMIILTLLMGWMVFIHGHGRFKRPEGATLLVCFLVYQFILLKSTILL